MCCGQGRRWWLIGARPCGHSGAWALADGGAIKRGGHGDPGSGLTKARAAMKWPGNGGEENVEEALGAGSSWARREEKDSGERCGGGWRGSPFI
jgi:hypothetical protein